MKCMNCGAENAPMTAFCGVCGTPLEGNDYQQNTYQQYDYQQYDYQKNGYQQYEYPQNEYQQYEYQQYEYQQENPVYTDDVYPAETPAKKKNKGKIAIILILVWLVLTLVLTGAFFAIYKFVISPKLNEPASAISNEAFVEVLPEGKDFEQVDLSAYELPDTVTEAYTEAGGGCVVKLVVDGYGSDMVIMCGINAEGEITVAKCLSSNETLGTEKTYGDKASGCTLDNIESTLDTVAGSTFTTAAYKNALIDALNAAKAINGNDTEESPTGIIPEEITTKEAETKEPVTKKPVTNEPTTKVPATEEVIDGNSSKGVDYADYLGFYYTEDGYKENGPCYFVSLNKYEGEGQNIEFSVEYVGVNVSPYYTTGPITVKLDEYNSANFNWTDSWGNSGTGNICLVEEGPDPEIRLQMTQTKTAEFNRNSLARQGTISLHYGE